MEDKKIGKIIHDRRIDLKMSLEEVAIAMGTTKATVSRWENGVIKTLKHPQLYALSKVLYLPIDVILGEVESPEQSSDLAAAKIELKRKIDSIEDLEKVKQIDEFTSFVIRK